MTRECSWWIYAAGNLIRYCAIKARAALINVNKGQHQHNQHLRIASKNQEGEEINNLFVEVTITRWNICCEKIKTHNHDLQRKSIANNSVCRQLQRNLSINLSYDETWFKLVRCTCERKKMLNSVQSKKCYMTFQNEQMNELKCKITNRSGWYCDQVIN